MPHVFRLGVHPTQLPAFDFASINTVPEKPGVYIIYEPAGPFYVGRSGSNIRRRLLAHLNGTGNQNVKLATKIREVRMTLTFTYAVLPKANQAEVEAVLIASLNVAQLANMRREGLYEEQFTD
jgi:predicted GIY-YIG superfamily endonuclease